MSNKIKATSSLSADSTEVRYQKALKQITKLIGVNTELREEIIKKQDYLNQFQERSDAQTQQYHKVLDQKAQVQTQLKNTVAQRAALIKQNQEMRKQLNRLKSLKLSEQSHIRKKETRESYFDTEKGTESEKTMVELQKKLQNKDETIRELLKKVKSLESNSNGEGYKNVISEAIKSNINNNDLTKKLFVANQYIEKVNEENVTLKKRLIKAESSNKLMSARSLEALTKYSPQISPRNGIFNGEPRNSEEVLKRYKHLQEQNKKNGKKMEHLKSENFMLKQQNSKLKKQNSKFTAQINGYEALITKQQAIISELHSDYQKDVTRMTEDFKQKLMDQRENFSPAKSADHLKTIETLQGQIKGLKKKLQLYQIELTKYIKTLQAYKSKLTECEKDVGDLMAEREQLLDRLSKLQSSNRERSNHSRGSASRIMGDTDRRNSMGDTGYFNYS